MKADIFHAYQALLKQTKPSSGSGMNGSIVQDPNSMEAEEGPIALLQAQVKIWRLHLAFRTYSNKSSCSLFPQF